MSPRHLLELSFGIIIVLFLIIDLGFLNKKAHTISIRAAAWQSAFWVTISLIFAGCIAYFYDGTKAVEFLSAYATEKMLSVDNLFVILLLFNFFNVEQKYQHRILFYGILGALILRALFIGLGSVVVAQFSWILYIFGAILIYTGIKLFFDKKEEHVDFRHSAIYRLAHRLLHFSSNHHQGKFLVRENGKLFFTSLFLVMILIEWTDLVFAIDSLPAAFSISQDPFVVYTSNIFAILGLRAMFFLLEAVINRFHHLQKGLSLVLFAIGAKMLLVLFGIHISSGVSFVIVMSCLLGSLVLSVIFPKKI
ncbi:MAG: TerC/Alx family metal homeostasis membrane protein [Candidatus Peregrinibacteria bacterium]